MSGGRSLAPGVREWKWSPAEKAAARRAFDLALQRELETVVQEAKERAARIGTPSELWELESWLGERRRDIDGRFDYRYSVLPSVFAMLLHLGSLTEGDLRGIDPEKVEAIRQMAHL